MSVDVLQACEGFDWGDGNSRKIWERHGVLASECEQGFLNRPLVVADDASHSQHEPRYYALGKTDLGRRLFVVFTIRGDLIRAISAREMSRREREVFAHAEQAE
jgi:uncharacterized DUF497 family protein